MGFAFFLGSAPTFASHKPQEVNLLVDEGRPTDRIVEMARMKVSPRQTAPAVWKATKAGHVVWITALPSATPPEFEVNWSNIDTLLNASKRFLTFPSISTSFDVSTFRVWGAYRQVKRARRNPNGLMLKDVVSQEDYRRWAELLQKYMGRERDLETLRPNFAIQELYGAALRSAGLGSSTSAYRRLRDQAASLGIPIVSPRYTLQIDLSDGAVRNLTTAGMDSQRCFRSGLRVIEQFPVPEIAQANAWSEGDVAGMAPTPTETQWRAACDGLASDVLAILQGQALDIGTEKFNAWLNALEEPSKEKGWSFAVLPIYLALGDEGYLEKLKNSGYEVSLGDE